ELWIAIAGQEAERIATGDAEYLDLFQQDTGRALRLAGQIVKVEARTQDDVLASARAITRHLLKTRWNAVRVLAYSLQIAGDVLDGRDCEEAIATALQGRVWRRSIAMAARPLRPGRRVLCSRLAD